MDTKGRAMGLAPEILEQLHHSVTPSRFLEYTDYLAAVYEFLKTNLDRYSYTRLSDDLGFSKTNVAFLIIKGQRPLSNKAALKIVTNLALKGLERQYFRTLVQYKNATSSIERDELFQKLVELKSQSLDSLTVKSQLDFFSEWYHVAIYELMMLPNFCSDPAWIAMHLEPRIRPEQARRSLHLLESLELAKMDREKGRHVPTKKRITTGDEIASVAIIRYHHKLIEMAKEAITRVNDKERDISSLSIAVPRALLPKLKQEISLFRKKVLALAEAEKYPDSVYQMNIQLFPLTKKASE